MIKLNFFFVCIYLSLTIIVFECRTEHYRSRCSPIRVNNGRVRLRSSGRVARVTCSWPYMLIKGNEITTCVLGEWDEYPICATGGCNTSVPQISNGKLVVTFNGAKIEVKCDPGYTVDGPSFIYCNQQKEWNEDIKGCKQLDEIYFPCDFESSDERFCGWQNDNFNDVDWLADKMSFLFSPRRHVSPGSSQYFTSNYISLDARNYGSSTSGRLLSPILGPVKSKQRCLIFSYKVTEGNTGNKPILTVSFGGIPHWSTNEGEGKAIIGLYGFNYDSKVVIEGKNCKVAIDNLLITEGYSCTQKPYEEEIDTCNDNCGISIPNESRCSCDWECQSNNNCCSDIRQKCPYIKPLDQIARLYLTTTTATPSKSTVTIKSNTTNIFGLFSKPINELTTLNDPNTQLMTSNNTKNSTEIKNKYIGDPSTNSTSNITFLYPTFPTIIPSISTVKPITITLTIPTTTVSTEIPKINIALNSNQTSLLQGTQNKTIRIISSVTPPIFNISTNISKLINSPTNYSVITSTTPSILESKVSNLTIQPRFEYKLLSISKINNPTNVVTPEENTTMIPALINIYNSTTKPGYWSSIIFQNISANKELLGEHTIDTKSVNNTSSSNIALLVNNNNTFFTYPTTKLIKSTTITMPPIQYNIATIFVKHSNFTKKNISELPNIQKIARKLKITENKSTTNKSDIVENVNRTTVNYNKLMHYDVFRQNSHMESLKYSKYNNVTTNIYGLSNVTAKPTFFLIQPVPIHFNFNMSRKNVKISITTTEISHAKPELNYSLHNQHMQNVDTWLAEYVKQNDNAEKYVFSFDTVTDIFKYIAAIGIIFVTFKYTFSYIVWYFKKPTDDEMNSYFINSDTDGSCNIELTSNLAAESAV